MSDQTNLYINPMSDAGFRHIFAPEQNKGILIEFLNVLFDGESRIVNLSIIPPTNPEIHPPHVQAPLLEVNCVDQDGDQFNVTMAHLRAHTFLKVNQDFISRHYQKTTEGGGTIPDSPRNRFLICFLDFSLSHRLKYLHFKSVSAVRKDHSNFPSGVLGFKFMEIPSFSLAAEELENDLEKWVYLLKNLHHLTSVPQQFNSFTFQQLFKAAALGNCTTEEKKAYEEGLRIQKEMENSAAYLEEKLAYAAEQEKTETKDFENFLRDVSRSLVMKIRRASRKEAESYLRRRHKRKS